MTVRLTDADIARLLAERKRLPADHRSRLQLRPKRGHLERELEITGDKGGQFRVILRESLSNPLDFSVILAYLVPKTNQVFRLRRYNGKSHEHTNLLEGQTFYGYHIHIATERYQELGREEDSFAVPTDSFADLRGALQCMLTECGFELPPELQLSLFGDEV